MGQLGFGAEDSSSSPRDTDSALALPPCAAQPLQPPSAPWGGVEFGSRISLTARKLGQFLERPMRFVDASHLKTTSDWPRTRELARATRRARTPASSFPHGMSRQRRSTISLASSPSIARRARDRGEEPHRTVQIHADPQTGGPGGGFNNPCLRAFMREIALAVGRPRPR